MSQPHLPCSMSGSQPRATGELLWAVLGQGTERGLGSTCQTRREGSEGLVPARGHQQQGCQAAGGLQPHTDDAIVQSHRTISLGRREP